MPTEIMSDWFQPTSDNPGGTGLILEQLEPDLWNVRVTAANAPAKEANFFCRSYAAAMANYYRELAAIYTARAQSWTATDNANVRKGE